MPSKHHPTEPPAPAAAKPLTLVCSIHLLTLSLACSDPGATSCTPASTAMFIYFSKHMPRASRAHKVSTSSHSSGMPIRKLMTLLISCKQTCLKCLTCLTCTSWHQHRAWKLHCWHVKSVRPSKSSHGPSNSPLLLLLQKCPQSCPAPSHVLRSPGTHQVQHQVVSADQTAGTAAAAAGWSI